MQTHFFGDKFIDNKTNSVAADSIYSKKAIALYFSAHWCPPCRGFTPVLAEFYNEAQPDHKDDFEVVFCTSDQNNEAFLEYFETMPWKAIPFGNEKIAELKKHYKVAGIPTLVICKPDGTVINQNGRGDVTGKGPAAIAEWIK